MLIDFHTHAFPPKLAGRAVAQLSRSAGGLEPQTDGTLESLKALMDADGVDLSVVLTIATNPGQMHKVNDYAFEMDRDDRIVAFGSVHPDAPDALEELERIKAAGLKGVKLHPEYQGFYADEERMKPIYRKISQLGLITLFHAGEDYGYPPPYHAQPEHLKHALGWFDSPVVAAHWAARASDGRCWSGCVGRTSISTCPSATAPCPGPSPRRSWTATGRKSCFSAPTAPGTGRNGNCG